jgi:outer membrane protein OmpA-like peptidoglycan-associated protein
MSSRFIVAVPVAVMVIGGSTACATKKFVNTSVGDVNDKVDALGKSVEETQDRTRKNEGRISEVDQKAQGAAMAAARANGTAVEARSAANTAGERANAAGEKLDMMDKANRRLVFEVVLSEDEGNFKFAQTKLPEEAKQKIDQLIQQLKEDPKNVYIEIEGHTDNVGGAQINEKVGLERAQAVQRYLYDQYQVPLHKMNVISYGEEKPVAPNNTKSGRAQNRRVVIKILA